MAVLTKNQIKAGHWYQPDGTPAHRIATADGAGERVTTIRDAKRLGLFPSVTSILGILAKPGLETWKLNQVALATLRAPRQEAESDEYWCNRVRDVAFEQVEEAADLGTSIHAAVDNALNNSAYPPDLAVYVKPVVAWIASTGIRITRREEVLVNPPEGYAGRVDALFEFGEFGLGIIDLKTRKTAAGKPVTPYEGQGMQLAAYAAAAYGTAVLPKVLAANVYISTTEPGRVEVCKRAAVDELYLDFLAACRLWRALRSYDPRRPACREVL